MKCWKDRAMGFQVSLLGKCENWCMVVWFSFIYYSAMFFVTFYVFICFLCSDVLVITYGFVVHAVILSKWQSVCRLKIGLVFESFVVYYP